MDLVHYEHGMNLDIAYPVYSFLLTLTKATGGIANLLHSRKSYITIIWTISFTALDKLSKLQFLTDLNGSVLLESPSIYSTCAYSY